VNEDDFTPYARRWLLPFAVAIHPDYEIANHHRLIAEKLQELEARKITHLMVFMPPRHGKSMLISELFPAWYMGRHPEHNIIFTSYNQEVAADFGRKVRNMIPEASYQSVFPGVTISDDSSSTKRFHTNGGGAYFAVGAGGALTGRGGDLIIIDDIHKNREEAHSDSVTTAIKQWYGSTLYTRRMQNAVVVLVQTRWSDKDLPKHLLDTEKNKWEILDLPAISDEGKALWPTRFPISTLEEIKKTLGSADFEALYQQRPSPAEGSMIKRHWFKFYRELPKLTEKIQSWDLTFSDSKNSDFVVGQVWGSVGADKYLIDQIRGRMDFPTSIQAIRQFSYKHPETFTKIIEEKANGAAAIATLKREISGLIPYNPRTSKEARVMAISPEIEAGNVWLPDPSIAPWIGDWLQEVCAFPSGKHDDAIDAMTMALIRFRDSSGDRMRKLLTL
jgi:predicted phage terminase large subunit-like protein